MQLVYRILTLIVRFLSLFLMNVLKKEQKNWILDRNHTATEKFKSVFFKSSIWIHASSGEIEYAKPLIIELKKQHPKIPIVVSYSSRSAIKLFENIQQDVDLFFPLPWDLPSENIKLISQLNPVLIIFSRTDLWPNLILQSHKKNIPLGLISYFPKLGFLNRFILNRLLPCFSFISCTDIETQNKLESLISNSLSLRTDGDTRFDQVFNRLSQASKIQLQPKNQLFTFGSIWPEDTENLKLFWKDLTTKNIQLIICPHDVSNESLNKLKKELDSLKLSSCFLTEVLEQPNNVKIFETQALIVNQVGFLADLYRYSSYAFIGGSFKYKVHSVMEALACGLSVFVGPFIQNSPESLQFSKINLTSDEKNECKIVSICKDEKSLIKTFNKIAQVPEQQRKAQVLSNVEKNKGATQHLIKFISSTFLDKVNF